MPITKENYIFIYNLNDAESLELARYYASKYNMDTVMDDPSTDTGAVGSGISWEVHGQLVGIDCSGIEILSSEELFNMEVIAPIREALTDSSLTKRTIWGIILGYNVPGGFYVNSSKIVSSTSRVGRGCSVDILANPSTGFPSDPSTGIPENPVYYSYNGRIKNKTYNRSIFKRYSREDTIHSLVTARIDAPTLALAKEFVDNGQKIGKQFLVNGTIFIDPYSDRVGPVPDAYKQDILDFQSDVVPNLNLDTWSTVFMDPYIDIAIPFVQDDSFAWSWFTDRSDFTFFQSSTAARVFFYNADYDASITIRDEEAKTWSMLSLIGGYASTAGAMSICGIEGFLRPIPFFKALLNGSTLGEAYLFSLPYLDSSLTFIGDPLVEVEFPQREISLSETIEEENQISDDESWLIMSKDLARSAAQLYRSEQEALEIRNTIVDLQSGDLQIVLDLLYPSQTLYASFNEEQRHSQLITFVSSLFEYPTILYKYSGLSVTSPTIEDYLTEKEYKVSELLTEVYGGNVISSDNIHNEGWWEFEYTIRDESIQYSDYHFILEVYSDADAVNLVVGPLDSGSAINDGWIYEKERDIFTEISLVGVSSSYIGRKVRYQSQQQSPNNQSLTRGETYYFRIRQYDSATGILYGWRNFSDIIYT